MLDLRTGWTWCALTEARERDLRGSFALNAEPERLLQRQIDPKRDVRGSCSNVTRCVWRALDVGRVGVWPFTATRDAGECRDLFDPDMGIPRADGSRPRAIRSISAPCKRRA